jgi:hypothetical protein
MPRPRKNRTALASRLVVFRLTEAEYGQLEAIAARAGLRVNELARRITRRGRNRVTVQVTRRHDPAFIAQLRAIGNNLNQLTFRSHLTGEISPKVESLCDEIRQMVLEAVREDGVA